MILHNHHHHQSHPLTYVDSGRSETSADEATTCRNACRDTTCHGPAVPNRDHHYKILDLDPDGIQVMGEVDLQHLPEAVNREILKNSREIIFEEPETSREGSPLLVKSFNRRNAARHPLLDEERRSLHSSKRSLYHRNFLRGLEEDKRSLDGSRRNLHGSRRYLLVPLENKTAEAGNKENFTAARRHTGSRERLNAMRKNIAMKGSKEIELDADKGRLNSNDDRLMIEMEKSANAAKLQEMLLSEGNNRTSLSDPNLSPNEYTNLSSLKGSHPYHQSPIPTLPISPLSDASPESGFYEGTQWSSSPEYVRKDLRVPNDPVITRNRRSYENAQLQDVNEALSRPNSDNSSLDSEESTKNLANDGGSRKYEKNVAAKQPISYTSV